MMPDIDEILDGSYSRNKEAEKAEEKRLEMDKERLRLERQRARDTEIIKENIRRERREQGKSWN